MASSTTAPSDACASIRQGRNPKTDTGTQRQVFRRCGCRSPTYLIKFGVLIALAVAIPSTEGARLPTRLITGVFGVFGVTTSSSALANPLAPCSIKLQNPCIPVQRPTKRWDAAWSLPVRSARSSGRMGGVGRRLRVGRGWVLEVERGVRAAWASSLDPPLKRTRRCGAWRC